MPSGGAVTNVRLATTESWKDRQSGQQQERTEWHRVVFFNKLGEIAGEYLKKGSKVYVEGSIRTRKWQGQDGQDRYTTEIVANEMQMLDGRGGGDFKAVVAVARVVMATRATRTTTITTRVAIRVAAVASSRRRPTRAAASAVPPTISTTTFRSDHQGFQCGAGLPWGRCS